MDSVLLLPICDIAEWVKERERLLREAEDEMFREARDRATTDEERAHWDEFIALRERNLEAARRGRTP
jgi:hypothetical protein